MFKRDYLMRQFDMLSLVVSRVIQLIKEQKPDEALQAIDEEIERITGLDTRILIHLTHSDLITGLGLGETVADGLAKRSALVTLLATASEIYTAQGDDEEAYHCLLGALDLRIDILPGADDGALPNELPTVPTLVAGLKDYDLPPQIHLRLFHYYEDTANFADAEDLLFDMIEAEPDSPELVALGIAFYNRLLALTDGELEAGDLPRQEVTAGMAELLGEEV